MIEFENRLAMSGSDVPGRDMSAISGSHPLDDHKTVSAEQSDGRRYSGFRFFAGLILAIGVSLALWVGVIYVYSLFITL